MAQRARGRKPEHQLRIARERIDILFDLAEKELGRHPLRSSRYIELARKIGTRYNIRLSKEQKSKFCKDCNTLLKPGLTSEQRTNKGAIVIKCLGCNKVYRYPFKSRHTGKSK